MPSQSFPGTYFISLLVSTGIGMIIGLEREFRIISEKDNFAGLRTFPLVSVLGWIVALLAQSVTPWILVAAVVGLILFVSMVYYTRFSTGHSGITTEISLVIAFALGAMTSFNMIKEALAAAVITTTLLSLKDVFRSFISRITEEELFAFIKFIVLALLLLPFLSDERLGPGGVLNPRQIGWVAVAMCGISFVSYILIKLAGPHKGILFASFLGGLLSSTAIAWLFSNRSKTSKVSGSVYAAGITLASSIMPLRILVITLLFGKSVFLSLLWPCLLMSATGMAFTFFFMHKKTTEAPAATPDLGNPLNVQNGIGSAIVYSVVVLLVYFLKLNFGNRGLMISGFISGLADVDAISIAMAGMAQSTGNQMVVLVIVIAMISNTITKILIVLARADSHTRWKVMTAMAGIICTGGVYIALSAIP